jgi:hypothetical protein
MDANHPIFTRMSIGFYHPNFSVIFDKEVTTIRLTLGLDPSEIDLFAKCFESIDSLNGSASPIAQDKMLPSLISPVYRFRDAKAF